jgi:hypothetical protein
MLMLGDLGAGYLSSLFVSLCFLRESKCIIAGRQHKQTTSRLTVPRISSCLVFRAMFTPMPMLTVFTVFTDD